jgi:hypothetical protein
MGTLNNMNNELDPYAEDITEITLSSDFDDDSNIQQESINLEYVQDQKFKGIKRNFVIFNEVQLYYSMKSFRKKENVRHRLNLSYVNQKPERVQMVSWRWLSTAFAGLVWSMLLVYVGYFTQLKADYIVVVGVLLGAFSAISMMIFYYRTQDKLVFSSFVGGVPLFEVGNMKAGNQAFEEFMQTLDAHIEKGQNSKTMHQRLSGELIDLRRIRDEGMIDNETYENARSRIFQHEAYQQK